MAQRTCRLRIAGIVGALGLACSAAVAAAPAVDPGERAGLVAAIAARLDAEYVFPEVASAMGRALRRHERAGRYRVIDDPQRLAETLTLDLREVGHDKHLLVEYREQGASDEPEGSPAIADLRAWRPEVARDNFSFDRVERLDGNIGYLEFRLFPYPFLAAETATAAMTFVAHTDALIIDLRDNLGGDPAMVAWMASYLFDERTRLNDIVVRKGNRVEQYWTAPVPGPLFGGSKPVYLLTSAKTFSGAEDFSYALQALHRATVVGETTGGGAHPSRAMRVAAHFVVVMPYARSLSPITHADWEGSGVRPDIAVAADAAFETAWRLAVQRLVEQAADEGRRRELRALTLPRP